MQRGTQSDRDTPAASLRPPLSIHAQSHKHAALNIRKPPLVQICQQFLAFRAGLNQDAFEVLRTFLYERKPLCGIDAQVDDVNLTGNLIEAFQLLSHRMNRVALSQKRMLYLVRIFLLVQRVARNGKDLLLHDFFQVHKLLLFILHGTQAVVLAALFHQLLVRALLRDAVVGDDGNLVRILYRRKPVRDDQRRAPLRKLVKRVLYLYFGGGVKGGSRLVQNQDRRVLEEAPRDRDTLLLPAAQLDAPLANDGVIALRHAHDVLVDFRPPRRHLDFPVAGTGLSVGDVLADRARKEEHVLLHDADLRPERGLLYLPDVHAVKAYRAAGNLVKAGDEVADGRLSAAARPHEGKLLPGVNFKIHAPKHRKVIGIREVNVLKADVPPGGKDFRRVGVVGRLLLGAHDFQETLEARHAGGKLLHEIGELADGGSEGRDEQVRRNQVGERHLSLHDEIPAHRKYDEREQVVAQLDVRMEEGHEAESDLLRPAVGPVVQGKAPALKVLVAEALRHADARDARLKGGVYLGGGLLDRDRRARQAPAGGNHDGYHERQRDDDDEREFPADFQEEKEGAEYREHGDGKVFRPVVCKLGNLKEVGGRPRHDFSGAVRIVKAERQLFQMVKDIPPHVLLDAVAKDVPPVVHEPVAEPAEDEPRKQHADQKQEGAQLAPGDERIEGKAGEHGKGDVYRRDAERAGHVGDEERQVRLIIGKEDF